MSPLVEKLTAHVQRAHDGNVAAFAAEIKVEQSVVHRWLKGETRPVGVNLRRVLGGVPGLTLDDVYPADAIPAPADEPSAA